MSNARKIASDKKGVWWMKDRAWAPPTENLSRGMQLHAQAGQSRKHGRNDDTSPADQVPQRWRTKKKEDGNGGKVHVTSLAPSVIVCFKSRATSHQKTDDYWVGRSGLVTSEETRSADELGSDQPGTGRLESESIFGVLGGGLGPVN